MLEIDGSHGEGGGAIVRLSVALSALTGSACRIERIRAGRENPGLQRQHVAAVDAIAKLCTAKVKGNHPDSSSLLFTPGELKAKTLDIDVGTAGSIALVLQALMIPAMKCGATMKIKGGTVNKWAPSVSYIKNVTLVVLEKMGYLADITIHRHGFYPKAGGLVEAKIYPSQLRKLELTKPGKALEIFGEFIASEDLRPAKVLERMKTYALESRHFSIMPRIETNYVRTLSTGGGADLFIRCENSVMGSSAVAERRRGSEDVAKEALMHVKESHESGAALDEYMADQILPYLALGKGTVSVSKITPHCLANMYVIEKFLAMKFTIDGNTISAR